MRWQISSHAHDVLWKSPAKECAASLGTAARTRRTRWERSNASPLASPISPMPVYRSKPSKNETRALGAPRAQSNKRQNNRNSRTRFSHYNWQLIPREETMLQLARTALLVFATSLIGAQAADEVTPVNDLPNPYRTIAPWGQLPPGLTWGALNSVAIDNDGESVWVATRCGANPEAPAGASPFAYDSCAGSQVAPVIKLDGSGKVLRSFGANRFIFPHKIY